MDKKIGKLSFVFILFCNLFADQDVHLSVVTMQGKKVKKIATGKPFIIKTKVSGQTSQLPEPKIEGLDQFDSKNTQLSQSIRTINGNTTVEKEYNTFVQMNKEGTFTVGPAIINVGGKEKQSESVSFIVTAEQEQADENYKEAFVELEVNKKELFYGEPLILKIRFYYDDESMRIEGIDKPSFEGFSTVGLENPTNGKQTFGENEYLYLEWKATLYPDHEGSVIIPALKAVYSSPSARQQSYWSVFNARSSHRQHTIYSNAVKVSVNPLPYHDPEIKAVGDYSGISLHLTNQEATQGEGILLNLFVQGQGNSVQLTHPELDLPDDVTYYNSKSQNVTNGKVFEYILQGTEPGKYLLDEQSFIYFDLATQSYKTIHSQKAEFTILPGVEKETFVEKPTDKPEEKIQEVEQKEALPILEFGQWRNSYERVFSWFWFFIIAAFPCILFGVFYLKKIRKEYLEKNAPIVAYRKAFIQARKTFKVARKGNYDGQIYHMFITLFASRLKLKRSEITEELIEQTLKNAGVKDDKIITWRLLFAQLTETAFSSHRIGVNKDGIFNQTAYWLNELEKLI